MQWNIYERCQYIFTIIIHVCRVAATEIPNGGGGGGEQQSLRNKNEVTDHFRGNEAEVLAFSTIATLFKQQLVITSELWWFRRMT